MTTVNIGDIVEAELKQSGLSQVELARRVLMDPSALNRSIKGTREFKPIELAWIADTLKVTVDSLLGRNQLPFMAAARAANADDAHLDPTLGEAATLLYEKRRALIQLGVTEANHQLLPDGCVRPDRIALFAADQLEGAAGHQHPLAEIDELADAIESAFGIDVWVKELPEGVDGYSIHDAQTGVYAMFVSNRSHAQRIRFTMAHELAHLLVGDDTRDAGEEIDLTATDPIEQNANKIAGMILMPESKISSDQEVTRSSVMKDALRFKLAPSAVVARRKAHLVEPLPTLRDSAEEFGRGAWYEEWIAKSRNERRPKRLLCDLASAYIDHEMMVRPFAQVAGIADLDTARHAATEIATAN